MNATLTPESIETALVFTVAQIIEGEARCAYCERGAVLTIANGADPEPEPVCAGHWREWHDFTALAIGRLFEPGA